MVTNTYQTKDNLYKVIAKSNHHTLNNYYAILAFSCHTSLDYPPQKIFHPSVAFNSLL